MLSRGRHEVTTRKQLEKYPIGSLISYTDKTGIFKYGGNLCKINKDWFVFKALDFDKKVRFVNVDKMWVGDVFEVTGDTISFKKPENETKYPVTIGKHIVYYGTRLSCSKEFKATQKYERMLQWYDYFHSN